MTRLQVVSSIRTSPCETLIVDSAESIVLPSITSPVDVAVEIRNNNNPHNANPHPPQTDDLIFSPANAESNGVITTLVCVKKDARAAGLDSNPAVTNPCAPKFHNANSRPASNIGLIASSSPSFLLPSPTLVLVLVSLSSSPFSYICFDCSVAMYIGININTDKHCRMKLNTLATGAPSVA